MNIIKERKNNPTNFNKFGFYLRKFYPPKNITINIKEQLMLSILYHFYKTNFCKIDYKLISKILPFYNKEIKNIINDLLYKQLLYDDRGEIGLNSEIISLADNYPNIIFIEVEIIKNKALSFNERLVLCYLKSYCDKYKSCVSTPETIADTLNINLRTVIRALKKFQTLELLIYNKNTNENFKTENQIELNNEKIYDLYNQFKQKKISHHSVTKFINHKTISIEKQINITNNINNNIDNSKNTNITQNITNKILNVDKDTLKNTIKELADEYNLSMEKLLTNLLKNTIEKG